MVKLLEKVWRKTEIDLLVHSPNSNLNNRSINSSCDIFNYLFIDNY